MILAPFFLAPNPFWRQNSAANRFWRPKTRGFCLSTHGIHLPPRTDIECQPHARDTQKMFVGCHARRVVVRGPKIMLLDLIWQALGFKSSNCAQSKGNDPCHLVVHLNRHVVASRLTQVVLRAQMRTDIAPCWCPCRTMARAHF